MNSSYININQSVNSYKGVLPVYSRFQKLLEKVFLFSTTQKLYINFNKINKVYDFKDIGNVPVWVDSLYISRMNCIENFYGIENLSGNRSINLREVKFIRTKVNSFKGIENLPECANTLEFISCDIHTDAFSYTENEYISNKNVTVLKFHFEHDQKYKGLSFYGLKHVFPNLKELHITYGKNIDFNSFVDLPNTLDTLVLEHCIFDNKKDFINEDFIKRLPKNLKTLHLSFDFEKLNTIKKMGLKYLPPSLKELKLQTNVYMSPYFSLDGIDELPQSISFLSFHNMKLVYPFEKCELFPMSLVSLKLHIVRFKKDDGFRGIERLPPRVHTLDLRHIDFEQEGLTNFTKSIFPINIQKFPDSIRRLDLSMNRRCIKSFKDLNFLPSRLEVLELCLNGIKDFDGIENLPLDYLNYIGFNMNSIDYFKVDIPDVLTTNFKEKWTGVFERK